MATADEIARSFLHQASASELSGSPLYAEVSRRLATVPELLEVADGDTGHHPVRVLGALHRFALLKGEDPWDDPIGVIERHRDEIQALIATQHVQTNEVQRSWALLPAFLSLGAERLDLLELGPSAGLNLVWDRYRYRYTAGTWGRGDARLELVGDERRPVPAALLSRSVDVVRRRGIDLEPIDATADDAKILLRSFVWADQADRLDRLDRALTALAVDPPELVQGDYVDLLPALLEDRVGDDALLVVFQTSSTQYLSPERYAELRDSLARARGPVGWISTRRSEEEETDMHGGYELEVGLFPDRPRLVARLGYHGQWLEWLEDTT